MHAHEASNFRIWNLRSDTRSFSATTIYPPHPSFSTKYRSPRSWRPNLQSKANALSRSSLTSSSTPKLRAARASVSERVVGDGIRTSDWASGRPRPLSRAPTLVCRPKCHLVAGLHDHRSRMEARGHSKSARQCCTNLRMQESKKSPAFRPSTCCLLGTTDFGLNCGLTVKS